MGACKVVDLRHPIGGIQLISQSDEDCTNSGECLGKLDCEGPISVCWADDIHCSAVGAECEWQALARDKMLGDLFDHT